MEILKQNPIQNLSLKEISLPFRIFMQEIKRFKLYQKLNYESLRLYLKNLLLPLKELPSDEVIENIFHK